MPGDGEPLEDVVASLRTARQACEDETLGERIYAEAESLNDVAERDTSPDETRIHGHESTIRQIHASAGEDARQHLENALHTLEQTWRP